MTKLLVVGDSMLDVRLDCEVSRISPEGPVPIFDIDRETSYAGGAANVALNAVALGCEDVTLLTPVGMDAAGDRLTELLSWRHGFNLLPMRVQRSTVKTRVFVSNVLRARIDEDYILDEDEGVALRENFKIHMRDYGDDYDVIIFSDYAKGALRCVQDMIDTASGRAIVLVDPKGTNWEKYLRADIIKCNTPEFLAMHGTMADLCLDLELHALVRTAGAAGSTVWRMGESDGDHVPALDVGCVDPTGAGDSYLAALAVALAGGEELTAACRRASVAGALATCEVGTRIVTKQEVDTCLPRLARS